MLKKALGLLFAATSLASAEWAPKKGPLMTKWAKDVSPASAWPEYPRPQLVRQNWLNLNGLWQFAVAQPAEAAPIGKTLAEEILVPFPVESALSGVMKRADRVWYRKIVSLPKDWAGQSVLLHFQAVDWQTDVWVNGKHLGQHRGGFNPFTFDITSALKSEGEQEFVVGVFDPTDDGSQPRGKQVRRPEGIYYTPTTGIWQTVWLEPTPKTRIAGLKITPDIDSGVVKLTVHCDGLASNAKVGVQAILGGKVICEASAEPNRPFSLAVPDVKLWSPDTPTLYDLNVRLLSGDQVVDSVGSYFAMRKADIGPDESGALRLRLNGKPLFQMGPLDQGFWPDGLLTPPTDAAMRYDLEITKQLGFNMIRKHVKVEPDRWYYWCDKLGILVWQDMPSGGQSVAPGRGEISRSAQSAMQFETELANMINHLENHPSIFLWVVFNEGWGQFDTVRLTNWVKQRDPSRVVSCASGWNDFPVGDVLDVHIYPGPGAPTPDPKRVSVLGEFGGLGLKVDGHTWEQRTWGYRGVASQAELTQRYVGLLKRVHHLRQTQRLAAAVYTQTTDVETEANGLLTYDRAVIKVDVSKVAAANRGEVATLHELVPTAANKGHPWRYVTTKPADGWQNPSFDDSGWRLGTSGFGTRQTPGVHVRTDWSGREIWLRGQWDVKLPAKGTPMLMIHHDEDAQVYINGVLAATLSGYTTDYEESPITAEAARALQTGKNHIAIHCKQTTGGQYIDVGLVWQDD